MESIATIPLPITHASRLSDIASETKHSIVIWTRYPAQNTLSPPSKVVFADTTPSLVSCGDDIGTRGGVRFEFTHDGEGSKMLSSLLSLLESMMKRDSDTTNRRMKMIICRTHDDPVLAQHVMSRIKTTTAAIHCIIDESCSRFVVDWKDGRKHADEMVDAHRTNASPSNGFILFRRQNQQTEFQTRIGV